MEELKDKTFLIKVRSELFEYLKSENKHEKVGKLKIFLDKKRNRPVFKFQFNKKTKPTDFVLSYDNVKDFIYFDTNKTKETKDGLKFNSIDNFGNLVLQKEEDEKALIKNMFDKEKNKTKDIQIKEVKDGEKIYVQHDEIKLSGKQFQEKDKRDKKLRIDDEKLKAIVKGEVKKDEYITPAQISDKYEVPETQVKEILSKVCDKYQGEHRKYYYKIKDIFEE